MPIVGSPDGSGTAYRKAWSECEQSLISGGDQLETLGGLIGPTNQSMSNLIALDPDAVWNEATQTVDHSAFEVSPRIFLLPLHDPRRPDIGGANLSVVKVVAFFAELMVGPAQVRGRFLRAEASGESCGGSGNSFIVSCTVPAAFASWGRVKAVYR